MPEALLASPSCPCGEDRFETVHVYDEPPEGETRFDDAAAYHRKLSRCTGCGHFVSTCHLPPEILYRGAYVDATYGAAGIRAAYERVMALPPDRSDNAGRVRRVLAFAGARGMAPRATLLDVGSGIGVFPAAMKAAGWQVTALDPDPRAAEHARRDAGVEAICCDFMTCEPARRYGMVSLVKVLEHVIDPIAMLRRVPEFLAGRGFLYVEVPDGEAAIADSPLREEFFIEHLHGFSRTSLALAVERAGLRLLEIERLREPSGKYTLRVFAEPRGSPGRVLAARGGRWTRVAPLDSGGSPTRRETWQCHRGRQLVQAFDVEVTIGKALDVAGLKGATPRSVRESAAFLARTAARLYGDGAARRLIAECPCCATATADAPVAMTVFAVPYVRCRSCGHVFVREQPDPAALERLFRESDEHAAAYTDSDRGAVDRRLREVVEPKLDWVLRQASALGGPAVRRVADVGAGGGHFVEACRRRGLDAIGYELSRASRAFARQAFGLELRDSDFREAGADDEPLDVVTFWGLLEYASDPRSFLEAARRQLRSSGLLVVEVPRFECLGTEVQKLLPGTVWRHMDPTSHVNCFSDTSLATLLGATGFRPVAAWYFGMDAYELLVQLATASDDNGLIERCAHLLPGLQAGLDAALFCDDVVVAATVAD